MLTKKHYKTIAGIVYANTTPEGRDPHCQFAKGMQRARIYIARNLADYFADDNSRFDRDKFMAACGLD